MLSETLTGSTTAAAGTNAAVIFNLLQPFGASAARFFINGVDTRPRASTSSPDYRLATDDLGDFDFTAAANTNDFQGDQDAGDADQPSCRCRPSLFAAPGGAALRGGTPHYKVVAADRLEKGDSGATLRSTFYGDVLSPGTLADGSADVHTGKRSVWDLEGRYTFPHDVTAGGGRRQPVRRLSAADPGGAEHHRRGAFTSFSPFGFNGRFLYGRAERQLVT